jgi:hypothetical protein
MNDLAVRNNSLVAQINNVGINSLSASQLQEFDKMNKKHERLSLMLASLMKELNSAKLSLERSAEMKKYKTIRREVKMARTALEQMNDKRTGAVEVMLADYLPGKTLTEKLRAIDDEITVGLSDIEDRA